EVLAARYRIWSKPQQGTVIHESRAFIHGSPHRYSHPLERHARRRCSMTDQPWSCEAQSFDGGWGRKSGSGDAARLLDHVAQAGDIALRLRVDAQRALHLPPAVVHGGVVAPADGLADLDERAVRQFTHEV